MNRLIGGLLGGVALLAATGCNLENQIDVVPPPYTSELVVECYLEPGVVPRLTVTGSGSYLPTTPGTGQPGVTLPNSTTPAWASCCPMARPCSCPST